MLGRGKWRGGRTVKFLSYSKGSHLRGWGGLSSWRLTPDVTAASPWVCSHWPGKACLVLGRAPSPGALLGVPWTARSNQSILKETYPKYSPEGLMLKLKLQYIGHLMQGADSLEKTMTLGKTEGRRRGWWRMRWLNGITDSMDMGLGELQEIVKDSEACHAAVHEISESQRWVSDWTTTMVFPVVIYRSES